MFICYNVSGQRYIGLWQDDCRHGNGIIVTLDGMYFEGQFVQNKMTVNMQITRLIIKSHLYRFCLLAINIANSSNKIND